MQNNILSFNKSSRMSNNTPKEEADNNLSLGEDGFCEEGGGGRRRMLTLRLIPLTASQTDEMAFCVR